MTVVVVPFVAREREVSQIRLEPGDAKRPFMVADARKKAIRTRSGAKRADVWIDVFVEELANVGVDVGGLAIRVVVVTRGNDEVRVPAFDQVGGRLNVG